MLRPCRIKISIEPLFLISPYCYCHAVRRALFFEEVSGDAAYSGDYDHYCFNFGGWIHFMGEQIY